MNQSRNQSKMNRRRFLTLAGVGLGAALASRITPAWAAGQPAAGAFNLRGGTTPRNGVIRIGWESVKNLDPAFVSNDSEIAFVNAVYDYLLDPTVTDALAPRLAQAWDISEDGREYTFHLVEGVEFHDGRLLTAEDVVWSFNRLRDEALGSPKVSLYTNVASIEAIDDLNVVFTLKVPEPDFLYSVADSSAVIVPANSTDLGTTFIGSGPFKVREFIPEDRTIFVANEAYWIRDVPYLAGMEHRYLDSNAALEALRGGELDVVLRMPNARYVALQQEADLQTVNFPTSGHDVLRLRMDSEPGSNPKVRKALKMATNRAEINQFVQLGLGAEGRDTPIGPFFAAYFDPESPLPPYDPDGAKALLAEAGYANGLQFELHVPNTGGRPDFATVIKDQWAKAGVEVEIRVEDEAMYYSDNGWLEVPLGITGWGARPTPQQYLDFSLRSDGKWNETRIKNAELDSLIEIAGRSTDRDARIAAYKQIQTLLAEDGPVVIPYFFPVAGAARRTFEFEGGFQPQPFPGRTDFRRVKALG